MKLNSTQLDEVIEEIRNRTKTPCYRLTIDKTRTPDEIIWGDCGVANFFINQKDLENCDFSKVLYNWDCC